MEDNPADVELIRRELHKAELDFSLLWTQDRAGFIKALDESTPDVILLDYFVPGFDGMTALAFTRQRFEDTPVIIVSGAIGEETAVETLKAGASDYVFKQRLSRLGPVVRRALQEAADKAETKRTEAAGQGPQEQLRLLILEDNPSDVELMQLELRKTGLNFAVRRAHDKPTFMQALDELTPDLILVDYSLPGYDGLTALTQARQQLGAVPVVMVSGAIGEETAIETLRAGATDYVLKDRLSRLGPVVRRALQEARDLADRKRAEEAFRKTSQRLSSIIENSPLAMIEWDADYRIVRWTDEAERVLGWPCREMIGKRLDDIRFVHEVDLPMVQVLFADMKKGRRPRSMTTQRNYRKDGSTIYCEWYKSALYDDAGKLEGVIALVLDVTDKIRAQEMLESHVNHLQQAILPVKPSTGPGYKVASYYVPAFTEEEVGGDFYDVFKTETGTIGIIIGDVSGKGIPAAALAAVTRSTVRAFEFEMFSTADALMHANKVLYSYAAGSAFVTVSLVTLDPTTGYLRYSSAGHPPPAVYRSKTREVEWLDYANLPIRIFETQEFIESCNHLSPGDKLVFYTDGLSEAKAGKELFGQEGIEQVLRECGGGTPNEIVDTLSGAADRFAGGRLRDDTAIVVIERECITEEVDLEPAA